MKRQTINKILDYLDKNDHEISKIVIVEMEKHIIVHDNRLLQKMVYGNAYKFDKEGNRLNYMEVLDEQ